MSVCASASTQMPQIVFGCMEFVILFFRFGAYGFLLFVSSTFLSLFVTFSIFLMVIWVKKCTLSDTYSQL